MSINDQLLSCESSIRWIGQPVLPAVQYARELLWTEDFLPCPRSLFDAQVVAYSVDRDSGRAIVVFYLTSDPLDGIWPVPRPDKHGGRIVRFDSIKANYRRETFQPVVDDRQLNNWLTNREHGCQAYWRKWGPNYKAAKKPYPVFPPEKRGGFLSWLKG